MSDVVPLFPRTNVVPLPTRLGRTPAEVHGLLAGGESVTQAEEARLLGDPRHLRSCARAVSDAFDNYRRTIAGRELSVAELNASLALEAAVLDLRAAEQAGRK